MDQEYISFIKSLRATNEWHEMRKALKNLANPMIDVKLHRQLMDTTQHMKDIQNAFANSLDIPNVLKTQRELSESFASAFNHIRIQRPYQPIVDPGLISLLKENELRYDELEYREIDMLDESEDEGSVSNLLINESSSIKQIIQDIYLNNEELFRIQSREFEEVIAELLRFQGYEVQLTAQTRDGGYDIIAIQPIKGLPPIKILVECKRHAPSNPVNVGIVRAFRDVVNRNNAHMGLLCTSSYVTRDAKKENRSTAWMLDFKEKDHILSWVTDYTELAK